MSSVIDNLKQYPVAVIGAVVLILCGGIMFLRGGVVDDLSAQESELVARFRTINANVKSSKNLEEDVEALEAQVALIDERLFNRDQRSINTNFFYSFEDRLDILVSDVNQLTAEDPALVKGGPNALSLYSSISYDIKVAGTFEEVLRFVYEIHKASALMRVAHMQVDQAKAGARSGTLLAKLRVVVLAEKE